MTDGDLRGGFEYRSLRKVAVYAEEVVYALEVWNEYSCGRISEPVGRWSTEPVV